MEEKVETIHVSLKHWRERTVVKSLSDIATALNVTNQYVSMVENRGVVAPTNFRKRFIQVFGREVYDTIQEFSSEFESELKSIIKEKQIKREYKRNKK